MPRPANTKTAAPRPLRFLSNCAGGNLFHSRQLRRSSSDPGASSREPAFFSFLSPRQCLSFPETSLSAPWGSSEGARARAQVFSGEAYEHLSHRIVGLFESFFFARVFSSPFFRLLLLLLPSLLPPRLLLSRFFRVRLNGERAAQNSRVFLKSHTHTRTTAGRDHDGPFDAKTLFGAGDDADRERLVPRGATRVSLTFRKLRKVARRLDATDLALISPEDTAELNRRADWWSRSISEKPPAH